MVSVGDCFDNAVMESFAHFEDGVAQVAQLIGFNSSVSPVMHHGLRLARRHDLLQD
jgi:hypothetical protein